MKTVILLDGWIFRGEVEVQANSVTIEQPELVAAGAGWKPPKTMTRVSVPSSSVIAIVE